MSFFSNFFVLFVLAGILTRILNHFLKKKVKSSTAVNVSAVLALIFTGPILVIFLGFDVAIAEYATSLLAWLIIDHLWELGKRRE